MMHRPSSLTTSRGCTVLAAGALAAALAMTPAATAQNALGDGAALDGNTGYGTGGRNTYMPIEDFRRRNLVVTGNVAGGRGFQGEVGYTESKAFRQAVGSDANFGFRAGSYLSSANFLYSDNALERMVPAGVYGNVPFFRDTTPPNANESFLMKGPEPEVRMRPDRPDFDTVPGDTLRFTMGEPTTLGTVRDRMNSLMRMRGSTLTGLQAMRDEYAGDDAMSLYDRAAMRADRADSRENGEEEFSSPFRIEDLRQASGPGEESGRIDAQQDPMQITNDNEPDFEQMRERMLEQYRDRSDVSAVIGDPALVDGLNEQLRQLREELTGDSGFRSPTREAFDRLRAEEAEAATDARNDNSIDSDGEERRQPLDDGLNPADAPEADSTASDRELSLDDLAAILSHGQRVEDLSPDERSRLNRLIAKGEEQLAAGDYFLAERSFDRVRRRAENHSLATAGVIHAQIGAGLYGSATMNVRTLLTSRPEMIDARFGAQLLPPEDRLRAAIETTQRRLDGSDRSEYGLLLAYLGHQTGAPELIAQGLAALADDPDSATLHALLEKIWLADAETAAPSGN